MTKEQTPGAVLGRLARRHAPPEYEVPVHGDHIRRPPSPLTTMHPESTVVSIDAAPRSRIAGSSDVGRFNAIFSAAGIDGADERRYCLLTRAYSVPRRQLPEQIGWQHSKVARIGRRVERHIANLRQQQSTSQSPFNGALRTSPAPREETSMSTTLQVLPSGARLWAMVRKTSVFREIWLEECPRPRAREKVLDRLAA